MAYSFFYKISARASSSSSLIDASLLAYSWDVFILELIYCYDLACNFNIYSLCCISRLLYYNFYISRFRVFVFYSNSDNTFERCSYFYFTSALACSVATCSSYNFWFFFSSLYFKLYNLNVKSSNFLYTFCKLSCFFYKMDSIFLTESLLSPKTVSTFYNYFVICSLSLSLFLTYSLIYYKCLCLL